MVRVCENVEGASRLGGAAAVRKCRLNPLEGSKELNVVMSKLWLAAVLGVLLGLGVVYAPSSPANLGARSPEPNLVSQPLETQHTMTNLVRSTQPSYQVILMSLLIGVVVALPFFLLARKRN